MQMQTKVFFKLMVVLVLKVHSIQKGPFTTKVLESIDSNASLLLN